MNSTDQPAATADALVVLIHPDDADQALVAGV